MIRSIFEWFAVLHGGKKKVPEVVAEWHALVQGLCEVLCPWPPRHRAMTPGLLDEIASEHHYYVAGRALGVGAWLALVLSLVLTRV